MKILHTFILFSIEIGGGTSDLMMKITKAQAKTAILPSILSGNFKFDVNLADRLKGVKFYQVKTYLHKAGYSLMPGLIKWCRVNLKDFDLVHMHAYRTFQNVVIYYYCRKFNIPYVMDAHGSVPYFKRKVILKKIFDILIGKKILKNASFLISETQIGLDEYLDLDSNLINKNIVILSPPFDTDEYQNLPNKGVFRNKYNIAEKLKVISFLGRVHYIKGNDFLIKGFAEYVKKNQNIKLVIIGPDDGHMTECKNLIKQLKIEKYVIFTGFLAGEYKNSALLDSDIVVQLSRQEQGAWAPLEAVLCGTPIIVTEHTGTGEDIRRMDAGYLVKFDDVTGLSNMFSLVLENYKDALEKTSNAKQYIENNLSFNQRVHEYTSIYQKSLTKKEFLND